MKDDATNRLHSKPSKSGLVDKQFRWLCVPELADVLHYHAYCQYIHNRTYPGQDSRRKAETFPELVTYQEYCSMKKERLRRVRISNTVNYKRLLKDVGLTEAQVSEMSELSKTRGVFDQ